MNEEQKKLRRWFRRHGWHTNNTPTGQGFCLESPIENCAGLVHRDMDPNTKQVREFSWEKLLTIELDRFCCDYVTFSIFERRHWYRKDDHSDLGNRGYDWVPSDNFEKWPLQPTAYINIPARDIIKLAKLIEAAQSDWISVRKTKNHLNFMERIAKNCCCRWIGVNSSYDEIKWTYSNERIRQEMAQKQKSGDLNAHDQ